KRVDAIVIIKNIVYVIEFKVGEQYYHQYNIDQVWDYALDLKNFHLPSHNALLIPILICTEAKRSYLDIITTSHKDNLTVPLRINKFDLKIIIDQTIAFFTENETINGNIFSEGSYSPTPTII